MHLALNTAIAIDLVTVGVCSLIAWRVSNSFLHPSVMMIFCHFYIVTMRLHQLHAGYLPMAYSFVWPVQLEEVTRAAFASDIALFAISLGWIIARYWGKQRQQMPGDPQILLSPTRIQIAAALSVILACASIAYMGPAALHNPRTAEGLASSGYLQAMTGWAGWGFCLLLYLYGFRPLLLGCTLIVLISQMMFSQFRGVVIIPMIFLALMWLSRRTKRSLPPALIPVCVSIWLLWLPMKPVFYALQQGAPVDVALQSGIETTFKNFGRDSGSGIDFQFLDMVGSTMTLVDMSGHHTWGASMAPVLVSPYPRQLWPDKPQLNQYQLDLDIPARSMAKLNMTAGLIGQCYADFGWAGIVVIPLLISLAFSKAYHRLSGATVMSPGCLLYLLCLATFMQLYRDGLLSAIWFPFVHCGSVGWLAVSHWIIPPRSRSAIEEAPALTPVTQSHL
jgi:hypothetical protein